MVSNIRPVEMMFLDDLFDMHGGYVLTFSNQTFGQFFAEELNINIDDPAYATNGGSKGKRLRCFLQTADKLIVANALKALWQYREALRQRSGQTETVENAFGQLMMLINRLEGNANNANTSFSGQTPITTFDRQKVCQLRDELIAISRLAAQPRGYAFEKFLTKLFDTYGLFAKEPFRNRGEQIDGSFQLSSATYLLEAKWQADPIGVAELHTFHGKIEQKAAWTRGLFSSNSSFTEDGLSAFGRGKRIICMDGLDLYETLDRGLLLNDVLEKKVRKAAETGACFARIRDLFPI